MIKQFPQDEPTGGDRSEDARGGEGAPSARGAKSSPARKQRRWARERAAQGLYQQLMNPIPVDQLEAQFMEDAFMLRIDLELFRRILRGVEQHAAELDSAIEPHLDRPVNELDPIEHAILRLGAFELMHMLETPRAIVINEAVELAKRFGATDGHRYVNGVLDRLADRARPTEPRRRD
ncbi:transcription antitermination factor NusB [Guyparkeria hydrothermalis]|uniref:transcription antitermination factor NusB n=1 Tax=Guyparkeria TaxID=2035712 RepID=UPI0010AB94CD|nr:MULTISPECIES: transcription antitermination factor NusB [Guyparkeria]MCL7751819.1 transcription antitermination factor NusB [Guyparkeria hydrothermalis]TKA89335.1 transcription antitermination factor NusB [Guyparkeria sp. SB14A]